MAGMPAYCTQNTDRQDCSEENCCLNNRIFAWDLGQTDSHVTATVENGVIKNITFDKK